MNGGRTARLRLRAALFLSAFAATALAGHYRWTTAGPEPGLVSQIVVNPQNSDRLATVAGYYSQLVFWTSDRGATWAQDDNLLYASRLVQDPSRANVLYTIGATLSFSGVLKTTDGGASWSPAHSGLPANLGSAMLALAASSPDTLYAAFGGSPGQVFRSLDGGASWSLASSAFPASYIGDLQVDPTNASVLYAAGATGVLKSIDSGASWGPAGSLANANRIAIVATSPSTLYAGTWDTGVVKSTDGGGQWFPANLGIETSNVRDLAVDPSNPQKLWIALQVHSGTGGVWVSGDGGQSWVPVDLGTPTAVATAIAIDPRDALLVYAAASLSVLRGGFHASADGGSTWATREAGLSGYYSYAVACDAAQGGNAYGVSGANVFRTDDAGGTWSFRGASPFGLIALVSDPSDSEILYGGYVSSPTAGVVRSVDGGGSWNPATTGLDASNLYGLAISPSAPDHLLAAGFEGLFGTSNGGGLWSPLLTGEMRSGAFDPADPSILYAGLWSSSSSGDGLLRSVDGGASWTPPSGVPTTYAHVLDIAVPAADPDHVYAAFGQGVYRSADRGLSFASANTGLPGGFWPTRFAADPSNSSTLFVAGEPYPAATPTPGAAAAITTPTVFRTHDSAGSWIPVPGFLPGFSTLDLRVAADGRTVFASTLGGVFTFARSFVDVPDADLFWNSVDAAAMNGVTAGCGAGRFCPTAPTSRASVAVFLLRGKNGGLYAPPPATGTVFGDVAADSPAADFIEELANEGVTAGCGGGNYCPASPVTRAAMAVLVLKTLHGNSYVPPPATGMVFGDVPAEAFAADWIEELFAEGISAGCGSGNFCPDASLSRAQAAALVVRAFGLS